MKSKYTHRSYYGETYIFKSNKQEFKLYDLCGQLLAAGLEQIQRYFTQKGGVHDLKLPSGGE